MKTIFVCGGHFTPAKAVIEKIRQSKDWQIFYLGRKFALEGDKALSLEYQELHDSKDAKFLELTAGRPQRRFTSRTIPSLLKIPIGFVQSLVYVLRFHPDAIMSFGGYIAVPVATIGFLFRVPIIHHEQIPAFDYPSKYLTMIATKVLVSFEHLTVGKGSKWQFSGNPLRPEIFKATYSESLKKVKKLKDDSKLPVVYVTGGNQGAHIINDAVFKALPELLKNALIVWQTGDSQEFKDYDKITEFLKTLPISDKEKVLVQKFYLQDEIGAVFNLADVLVTRGGANTIFEIARLGKPAVIIPIPWVHNNEQTENAKVIVSAGAGVLVPQDDLTAEKLTDTLSEVLKNLKNYQLSAQKLSEKYQFDAAEKIVAEISIALHDKS